MANNADPDLKASSEAIWFGSTLLQVRTYPSSARSKFSYFSICCSTSSKLFLQAPDTYDSLNTCGKLSLTCPNQSPFLKLSSSKDDFPYRSLRKCIHGRENIPYLSTIFLLICLASVLTRYGSRHFRIRTKNKYFMPTTVCSDFPCLLQWAWLDRKDAS